MGGGENQSITNIWSYNIYLSKLVENVLFGGGKNRINLSSDLHGFCRLIVKLVIDRNQ